MSLNSVEEIRAFLNTIECGEPIFNIIPGYGSRSYGNSINIALEDWKEKEELILSDDPMLKFIGYGVYRRYDRETKSLMIDTDQVMPKVADFIQDHVMELARDTSPHDQPKKTNAYKDIAEIAYQNKRVEAWQNDILPILNYYLKAKTDSTNKQDMVVHNNNVQALLGILRKKYARTNSKR